MPTTEQLNHVLEKCYQGNMSTQEHFDLFDSLDLINTLSTFDNDRLKKFFSLAVFADLISFLNSKKNSNERYTEVEETFKANCLIDKYLALLIAELGTVPAITDRQFQQLQTVVKFMPPEAQDNLFSKTPNLLQNLAKFVKQSSENLQLQDDIIDLLPPKFLISYQKYYQQLSAHPELGDRSNSPATTIPTLTTSSLHPSIEDKLTIENILSIFNNFRLSDAQAAERAWNELELYKHRLPPFFQRIFGFPKEIFFVGLPELNSRCSSMEDVIMAVTGICLYYAKSSPFNDEEIDYLFKLINFAKNFHIVLADFRKDSTQISHKFLLAIATHHPQYLLQIFKLYIQDEDQKIDPGKLTFLLENYYIRNAFCFISFFNQFPFHDISPIIVKLPPRMRDYVMRNCSEDFKMAFLVVNGGIQRFKLVVMTVVAQYPADPLTYTLLPITHLPKVTQYPFYKSLKVDMPLDQFYKQPQVFSFLMQIATGKFFSVAIKAAIYTDFVSNNPLHPNLHKDLHAWIMQALESNEDRIEFLHSIQLIQTQQSYRFFASNMFRNNVQREPAQSSLFSFIDHDEQQGWHVRPGV